MHDKNGRPTGKTTKRKRGLPSGLSQNDTVCDVESCALAVYILTLFLARSEEGPQPRLSPRHVSVQLLRNSVWLEQCDWHHSCVSIGSQWSDLCHATSADQHSIGDFLDAVMAWMLMRKADKIDGGLPPALRARMLFNIVLDFCLGLVPLLGDLADAVFRANTRNAWLLEAYLVKKAEAEAEGDLPPPSSQGEALLRQKGSAKTESNTAGGFFGLGRRKNADEEMDVGTASNRTGGRGTAGNPTTVPAQPTSQQTSGVVER